MSRGGYSAAIDIWGLGCILGELLQRVAHVGSAATPNLQARRLCIWASRGQFWARRGRLKGMQYSEGLYLVPSWTSGSWGNRPEAPANEVVRKHCILCEVRAG
jgi:hypothetical protein